MIICFVLIYMLITLKGHTFSFSLWQENTEDIIYITWWTFCHLCAKLMIGNGSPVQNDTMGRLYITGYRQALTWSPIIQVSLAGLMSTEEPSKTCLLLKKQLSSRNKNTAHLQHFTYTIHLHLGTLQWSEGRKQFWVSAAWMLKDASINTGCMLSHWDAEHNIHFQFSVWLETANDNVVTYSVDQHAEIKCL